MVTVWIRGVSWLVCSSCKIFPVLWVFSHWLLSALVVSQTHYKALYKCSVYFTQLQWRTLSLSIVHSVAETNRVQRKSTWVPGVRMVPNLSRGSVVACLVLVSIPTDELITDLQLSSMWKNFEDQSAFSEVRGKYIVAPVWLGMAASCAALCRRHWWYWERHTAKVVPVL